MSSNSPSHQRVEPDASGADRPPICVPDLCADWAFFLDVDGTLLDYAPTPDSVVADARTRRLIERLQSASDGAVALISGRAASDLDRLFSPLRTAVAGQHGVERRDAGGGWHRHALPEHGLRAAAQELSLMAASHPGLVFEDKGLNLAVHYRLAPSLGADVERLMRRLLGELGPQFELQGGKMIWELKPSGRDKGMAVQEFLQEPPFAGRAPVFIGDDLTDESAFQFVNQFGGVSVKVGPGTSSARFRLLDAESVRRWLESWADWMSGATDP
jgi:trehalose 6-phosphate phosphatase